MDEYPTLAKNEKQQISTTIERDLVDHLYKSTLSGVFTGCFASISIFAYLYFYESQIKNSLLYWFYGFNFVLISLVGLYTAYNKKDENTNIKIWKFSFFAFILVCSMFWGGLTYFITNNIVTQIIIIIMVIMLASAYSIGTVGSFVLCVGTLLCILLPLCIWAIMQEAVHYTTGAAFIVIYLMYLLGMNYRSTDWLKGSLRLEIEKSFFTHQANHDFITGLPNYRALLFHIEESIVASNADNRSFMIVYFSIDSIDMFEISMGYQAVDEIMLLLAQDLNIFLLVWMIKKIIL